MLDILLYAAVLVGGILIGATMKSVRLDALERRVAGLEVRASELRHAAGITPVDELDEAARADAR